MRRGQPGRHRAGPPRTAPDSCPVQIMGEEDAELDLAGAGAAVVALAVPPGGFLRGHRHAGAVDRGVQLVRQRGRRQRHQFAGGDQRCQVPDGGSGGGAAVLGCSSTRLTVSRTPARTSSSRAAFANGPAAAASSFIARSPGGRDAPATPSPASRGANPCPQDAQWYHARVRVTAPSTVSMTLSR